MIKSQSFFFFVKISVFAFEQHGDDTEATDTAVEETKENVSGGDEPKCEKVNCWVAIIFHPLIVGLGPVYSVDPNTT